MIVGELSKLIKAPFAYDGMSTLFALGELPPIPDIKPSAEFYTEKYLFYKHDIHISEPSQKRKLR
jgi:hypothetical protein